MQTQLNQEFTFAREISQMGNEWNNLVTDSDFDTLSEILADESETPYLSSALMWEELEGVNKFIDLAGY